jgi:hypothetical protein
MDCILLVVIARLPSLSFKAVAAGTALLKTAVAVPVSRYALPLLRDSIFMSAPGFVATLGGKLVVRVIPIAQEVEEDQQIYSLRLQNPPRHLDLICGLWLAAAVAPPLAKMGRVALRGFRLKLHLTERADQTALAGKAGDPLVHLFVQAVMPEVRAAVATVWEQPSAAAAHAPPLPFKTGGGAGGGEGISGALAMPSCTAGLARTHIATTLEPSIAPRIWARLLATESEEERIGPNGRRPIILASLFLTAAAAAAAMLAAAEEVQALIKKISVAAEAAALLSLAALPRGALHFPHGLH